MCSEIRGWGPKQMHGINLCLPALPRALQALWKPCQAAWEQHHGDVPPWTGWRAWVTQMTCQFYAFDAEYLFGFESRIFNSFIWGTLAPTRGSPIARYPEKHRKNESWAGVEGPHKLVEEASCAPVLGHRSSLGWFLPTRPAEPSEASPILHLWFHNIL